jgi:hypothetical protein
MAQAALDGTYLPLIPLLPVLILVTAFAVLGLVSPFLPDRRRRYIIQILRLFVEMIKAIRTRRSTP